MFMLLENLFYLMLFFIISLLLINFFLKKNKALAKMISIFLSLHVMLVAVILTEQHSFETNLARSFFMDDGEAYSANGWQISTALTGDIPDIASVSRMRAIHLTDRGWGLHKYYNDYIEKQIIAPPSEYEVGYISYLYALIYATYGFKPVIINFMNVILHLLTAVIIYQGVKSIFDRRVAYLSTLFFLLNPISFYYSSTKLQEALFTFVVYLSVYCFILTVKKQNCLCAFSIVPLFYVIRNLTKTYYFIPLLAVFLISALFIIFKRSKRAFFAIIILVILLLSLKHVDVPAKSKLFAEKVLNDSVIHQKGFYSTGGKVYKLFIPEKDSTDYTSIDWGWYIVKGWYHLLDEPILSSQMSLKFSLFSPLKIIFLFLCILAIPGVIMAMRYGHVESVIFFNIFIIIGTGLAISSGNIGTMLRHRDTITPAVFIFSSFYISRFYYGRDLTS